MAAHVFVISSLTASPPRVSQSASTRAIVALVSPTASSFAASRDTPCQASICAIRSRPDQPCAASIGMSSCSSVRSASASYGAHASPSSSRNSIASRYMRRRASERVRADARGGRMQRRGDDQPTVFTDAADAAQTQTPTQTPSAKMAASGAPPPRAIALRTGVVFVHGIGTQAPSETFLDWSGAIVELLTDWREAEASLDPPAEGERIDDPVWRAEFTFNAASPPYLELGIPEHGGVPATTWVITEAWWASDLRPPNLGTTIDYLRRRIGTVVEAISDGYRDRARRLAELALATDVIGEPPPLDWRLAEDLDKFQSKTFGAPPNRRVAASAAVCA